MEENDQIAPKRSPRGRKKNIKTPELLWQYFNQYRDHTKSNPILVQDFVGKFATEVDRKKERPLTMEGFENWLADQGIMQVLTDYMMNKENRYTEFATVCSRIKRAIRQDQIEGGMSGIYNPSITQRLNGLTEQVQQQLSGEIQIPVIQVVNPGSSTPQYETKNESI